MSKDGTRIYVYCSECGAPQGNFADESEMRRKIAEKQTCPKCNADFRFFRDGRIWNLWWENINSGVHGEDEKVYEKGETYAFYKDIKEITQTAKTEIFLIDAFVDEEALDLYLDKIPNEVNIRILTNKPKGNFLTVAKKSKVKPAILFEVRRSDDCHDRLVFVDDACWVMGQSVKDAGRKPTYLVKIDGYAQFKAVFEKIWGSASIVI